MLIKVRVFTEKSGWITHRLARELLSEFKDSKIYSGRGFRFKNNLVSKLIPKSEKNTNIFYYLPYYLIPKSKDLNNISVSCLTHFEPSNPFKLEGWNRAISNSDYLIAISEFTYREALNQGVDKNRIQIIRYGVDDLYEPTFNVLVVGRPGFRKGTEFFNNLRFILRREKGICWRSASEPGWDLPIICDDASDLTYAYAWADILIVTSSREGAHTGTLEAIFSGVRVLSRPVGWAFSELREIVEIHESENSMAKRILELKSDKFENLEKSTSKLNPFGFTYDNWRIEHKNVFQNLLKLRSSIDHS